MAENAIEDPELEIPAGEEELPVEQDEIQADPAPAEDADDELLVSFEGEGAAPSPSEQTESNVLRELRARNRELTRELEARNRPAPIEVGEKPTLEGFDYDADKYEAAYDAWVERKAQAQAQQAEANKSVQQQQEAWNKRVAEVGEQIASLKAKDFPQALEEVKSAFSEAQQVVIMRAPKNAANVIYALGKVPAKAAELAKISDPIELAAELARLEGKLTVTTRAKAPPPEQIVRGSAPLSPGVDKHEERLSADAARTGNYTKLFAYRQQKRAKARA